MDHTLHEPALEWRRLADCRAYPTTLWSALCWQGRRHGVRRAEEGRQAYVDCLACRTVVLALIVFGNSLLDAYLTLLHLEDGGSEANPLMHLTLAHSLTAFIVLKLSLIGVAVVADSLSALPLGHSRPAWCALSYGAVLVLHLIFSLHFIWKEHRCSTIRAPI